MESFFNISWTILGVIVVAAGLLIRRSIAPWGKKETIRDVLLLAAIVILLFPIVSISDDIGYFNHYFSTHRTLDSFFWVNGSRREKQFPGVIVQQALALLLATAVVVRCQRAVLGMIAPADSIRFNGRKTTATHMRAPPDVLLAPS